MIRRATLGMWGYIRRVRVKFGDWSAVRSGERNVGSKVEKRRGLVTCN